MAEHWGREGIKIDNLYKEQNSTSLETKKNKEREPNFFLTKSLELGKQ